MTTGTVASSAFGTQLIDHWTRQLDTGDRHSSLGKRDSHPARADSELERRSVARKLSEEVHGRPEDLRREHARTGVS
jgi:hypothetical protein